MAEHVWASFENTHHARRAIRSLVNAGFHHEDVTAHSTEPMREPEFLPPEEEKSYLGAFALSGGIVGAIAGYLLPALTARLMNLPTGGQPVVSLWPFGIIIFELAALGAIGGTFIALLLEMGLPRWKGNPYDEEFTEDLMQGGVLIHVTSDRLDRIEMAQSLLQEVGAKKVKRL